MIGSVRGAARRDPWQFLCSPGLGLGFVLDRPAVLPSPWKSPLPSRCLRVYVRRYGGCVPLGLILLPTPAAYESPT